MGIINWNLMRHPMNWLIIILMVMIAGYAVHVVKNAVSKPAAT